MKNWSLEAAVAAYFERDYKDGDLVTHYALHDMLDMPPEGTMDNRMWALTFMDRFEQFKDTLLRQHRIYLSNVRGKGYLVVPPDEQAHTAMLAAMNDIRRAAGKCTKALEYARVEEMSGDARRRHTDAQVRFAGLRGMLGKEKTNIFQLFNRTQKPEV